MGAVSPGAQTQVRASMVYVDRDTARRFDRMLMELGNKRFLSEVGCSIAVRAALTEQGRVQRDAYQRALGRLERWEAGA